MKRLLIIAVLMATTFAANAQTYYYMWRGTGDSGKPEWICNSAMACGYTGIEFSTADKIRGTVSGYGRWLFFDPLDGDTSSEHMQALNNSMNNTGNIAAGTQGYMAAKRWILTDLTNTIPHGAYFGYGRNNDITFACDQSKWMRFTSGGGIAFWGQGGGEADDAPQFDITNGEVNCNKRFNFRDDSRTNRASLMLGRNDDVAFWVTPQKWLRVLSPAGIGLWMNGNGETDDNPQILLTGTYAEFKVPVLQRGGAFTHIQNNISTQLSLNNSNTAAWLGTTTRHGMEIGTNGAAALYIGDHQNIFFGFSKSQADAIGNTVKDKYRVFVKQGILSEDYAIAPVNSWADYVFTPQFELKPLNEVEEFVATHNHLPDVPSAEEVKESGYSQHDMNVTLLQKIEELTLYIIEQEKRIDDLQNRLR